MMWRWFSHMFPYFPIFSHIFTYHHLRPTRHLHDTYTGPTPSKRSLPSVLAELPTTNAYPWWLSPWCSPRSSHVRCCPNFTTFYKRKPTVCWSSMQFAKCGRLTKSQLGQIWTELARSTGTCFFHSLPKAGPWGAKAAWSLVPSAPGETLSLQDGLSVSTASWEHNEWIQRPQNHVIRIVESSTPRRIHTEFQMSTTILYPRGILRCSYPSPFAAS